MKAAFLLFFLLVSFYGFPISFVVGAKEKLNQNGECVGTVTKDGGITVQYKRSSSLNEAAVDYNENKDLKIEKPGFVQIKLNTIELRFLICADKCRGRLTVCYKSIDYSPSAPNVPVACREANQCGFDIKIGLQNMRLMDGRLLSKQRASQFKNQCSNVLMQYQKTKIFGEIIDTCRPEALTVSDGYILVLNVINASPQCPLIIKNAQLDYSTAFTLPESATWYQKAYKEINAPSYYRLPIWFWIIVFAFSFVFVVLFILLIWLCIYVKCFNKKKQPKKIKECETPKLLETMKDVEEEEEEEEEETTELQNESSIESEASEAPFVPTFSTPNVPTKFPLFIHLPLSMKPFFTKLQESKTLPSISPSITTTTTKNGSQKTDSIPERAELNKKLLIEPHYASLLRHKCLGEHNSAKAREMRRRYPRNMGRPLQFREIKYLSLTVAQMFKEVNKMCRDAEDELKSHGIVFDEKKGIIKMTENGRKFIENSKTPDFIAYFAFGAEYFEFVNSDMSQLSKFSLPLLFTISMMPRIEDANRRKALSCIRRQIPKVREIYSVAERETMAFPINAIEDAVEMPQNGFEDLDKLLLMSRQLMEDKTQRDCQIRAAERIGKKKKRYNRRKAIWDLF